MKRRFYIPLACDLQAGGAELGHDAQIRLLKAFCQLRNHGCQGVFITSAGMADAEKYPKQTESMAQMQLDWLRERSVNEHYQFGEQRLICPPEEECVWGTRPEIETAFKIIFERIRNESEVDEIDISLITSWYHMPRSWFVFRNELSRWKKAAIPNWNKIHPEKQFPKITPIFISSPGKRWLSALFWEPIKIPVDFWRNWFGNRKWSSVQNSPF